MNKPTAGEANRDRPFWLLGVVVLVLAQLGLGLALFSTNRSWAAVLDEEPILSGRHPLHLYHGTLGASAFAAHGVTICYDLRFQAGYPKTPVFDGGSRPAELFLFLGGGTYRPSSYKLGLFGFVLMIPVAFVMAARGAGLRGEVALLSGCGGILLGWSSLVRQMLVEGQLDLLGAGLAGLVFISWLTRYASAFGVEAWLVLAATGVIGWYLQPFIWLGLAPVIFAYYLVFAPRFGPAWHLGLAGVTFVGIAPNAWWLSDWVKYWWLQRTIPGEQILLVDWHTFLGTPGEYARLFATMPGGVMLLAGGCVGLVFFWRMAHRTAALLLFLATLFTLFMARMAGSGAAMPHDLSGRVMVLAAAFLIAPLANTTWLLLRAAHCGTVATVLSLFILVLAGWSDGSGRPLGRWLGVAADPLAVGLSDEQLAIIAQINEHATPEARVLWDESANERPDWNWSALLPLYTNCSFLGGLDPEAGIEHSYCALCRQHLTGRRLNDWNDEDLLKFCTRYNVGWVVARTPEAIERWGRLPQSRILAKLTEDGHPIVFYSLDRTRSFILSGSATWESAENGCVILTNVVPDQGVVKLSLHMLNGFRVSPSYIQVESDPDPTTRDPVGHVKLLVPTRVPRVMLIWENP